MVGVHARKELPHSVRCEPVVPQEQARTAVKSSTGGKVFDEAIANAESAVMGYRECARGMPRE